MSNLEARMEACFKQRQKANTVYIYSINNVCVIFIYGLEYSKKAKKTPPRF